MEQREQIIHVELNEPFLGKKNHYFGSVSAVFDKIPVEKIGVQLRTVRKHLAEDSEYKAPGAIIRRSIINRKQQRRK